MSRGWLVITVWFYAGRRTAGLARAPRRRATLPRSRRRARAGRLSHSKTGACSQPRMAASPGCLLLDNAQRPTPNAQPLPIPNSQLSDRSRAFLPERHNLHRRVAHLLEKPVQRRSLPKDLETCTRALPEDDVRDALAL